MSAAPLAKHSVVPTVGHSAETKGLLSEGLWAVQRAVQWDYSLVVQRVVWWAVRKVAYSVEPSVVLMARQWVGRLAVRRASL